MVASLLALAGCGMCSIANIPPSGDGLFSVAEGRQVRFAPGNLEYDSIGGYHFAAHQYSIGGYFGWGTGSTPTHVSKNSEEYPAFDDWGSHIDGGWRTLAPDEWSYLLFDRANASAKSGAATVCGVPGIILLPDNWGGGAFNAGFRELIDDKVWSSNVYDASAWSAMEEAGAVFLPAAGDRHGTSVHNEGAAGSYWSSEPYAAIYACYMNFSRADVGTGFDSRCLGHSVRLVRDV